MPDEASREAGANALERLQRLLDDPEASRGEGHVHWPVVPAARLPPTQRSRAEALYRRLVERKLAGDATLRGRLLDLLAHTREAGSLPFWRELLAEPLRPRDPFRRPEVRRAVAAVARLALDGDADAGDLLRGCLHAEQPEVRAHAVEDLLHVAAERGEAAAEMLEALSAVADEDPARAPRLRARLALRSLGREPPLDHPDALHRFRVDEGPAEELRVLGRESVARLHAMVLEALNEPAGSGTVRVPLPAARDVVTLPGRASAGSGPTSREVRIGELGLVPGGRVYAMVGSSDEPKPVGLLLEAMDPAEPDAREDPGASDEPDEADGPEDPDAA